MTRPPTFATWSATTVLRTRGWRAFTNCSSMPVRRRMRCLCRQTWPGGLFGHARAEGDGPSSLWLRRWHP